MWYSCLSLSSVKTEWEEIRGDRRSEKYSDRENKSDKENRKKQVDGIRKTEKKEKESRQHYA